MNRKQTRKTNRKPAEWQTNPANVTTSTVQYWRNGIMLTAQMKLSDAREAIVNGNAFVITDQAIGAIINGEMAS